MPTGKFPYFWNSDWQKYLIFQKMLKMQNLNNRKMFRYKYYYHLRESVSRSVHQRRSIKKPFSVNKVRFLKCVSLFFNVMHEELTLNINVKYYWNIMPLRRIKYRHDHSMTFLTSFVSGYSDLFWTIKSNVISHCPYISIT